MYFRNFPFISYSLDSGVTAFTATDFFRRVKANAQGVLGSTAYDEYDIKEGETPDILADKLYGDTELHWVILITNDIIDPRYEWPQTEQALLPFIYEKYGKDNIGDVHHYVNADGDIVHSSYAGAKTAVTNYEYELTQNEAKRRIKVIKPIYVSKFIESFIGILNNGDDE